MPYLLCFNNKFSHIMKVNEQMENSWIKETPVWNKENNPCSNNTHLRTKNLKTLRLHRPTTPIFETTFNPYPHHNGFSIPLITSKRTPLNALASLSDSNDIREGLAKLSLKQKPIIAKSSKLKDFFTHKPIRYLESDSRERKNNRRIKGRSLNILSIRRDSLETLSDPIHKVTHKPIQSRKQ
jgi:hypothetical protein